MDKEEGEGKKAILQKVKQLMDKDVFYLIGAACNTKEDDITQLEIGQSKGLMEDVFVVLQALAEAHNRLERGTVNRIVKEMRKHD